MGTKLPVSSQSSQDLLLFVLITVPHYTCIFHKGMVFNHNCDKKAELLADMISQKLSENNIKTKILLGGINRTIIDLNRFESRHTNFRKKIRSIVENALPSRIVLLDCHSFNENHTFFERYVNPDFVIISDNLKKFKSAVLKLRDMLEETGIKTNVLSGIKNDIIDEFEDKVFIPVLLEASENLDIEKMNNISATIKDWIMYCYNNY